MSCPGWRPHAHAAPVPWRKPAARLCAAPASAAHPPLTPRRRYCTTGRRPITWSSVSSSPGNSRWPPCWPACWPPGSPRARPACPACSSRSPCTLRDCASGFNQATELARVLGRRLGIGVDHRLCQRVRWTEPQSTLPLKQRRANLRNAFTLNGRLAAGHIALVDDVMTSGHTSNELARVLKQAGARHVEVWVIARAGY